MQAPENDTQRNHGAKFSAENLSASASIVEAHDGADCLSPREDDDPVPPETLLDKATYCEGEESEARESSEDLRVFAQDADDLGSEPSLRQVDVTSSSTHSLSAVDSERGKICNLSARGVANRLVLQNFKRDFSLRTLAVAARIVEERAKIWARNDGVPAAQCLLDAMATELRAARRRSRSPENEEAGQEMEDLDLRARLVDLEDA